MKKTILTLLAGTLLLATSNEKVLSNTDQRLSAKQDQRQVVLNSNLSDKEAKWAKKEAKREAKLKAKDKKLKENALRREQQR